MNKAQYRQYRQSPEWQARRATKLHEAGYRCAQCNTGGMGVPLDVHHKTYSRIGHEHDGDLVVLCRDCHRKQHQHANGDDTMTENPWLSKISITRITRLDTGVVDHPVRAFASVAVGSPANPSIVIHGCRIAQRRGEDAQVLMPVRETDGFAYGVEVVDGRLRDAIEARVLAAWRDGGGA